MSHAMTQHSVRTAVIALAATFAWFLSATAAHADPRTLVVRVYDTTDAAADIRDRAIRTASAIVEDAGIPVEWRDCTQAGSVPACQRSSQRDIIVRIMPAAAPGTSSGSSLLLRTARTAEPVQLGLAVLNPVTLTGQMATIFNEQVRDIARRTGVDAAELLGRAFAHELGHLLLRTGGHSATGLMREVWSLEELTLNRDRDWLFASGDRRRLQQEFDVRTRPDQRSR